MNRTKNLKRKKRKERKERKETTKWTPRKTAVTAKVPGKMSSLSSQYCDFSTNLSCPLFSVFPQGKKAARAMLIAIAAAVFSISGVGGCNFLSVGEGDGDSWGFLWRKQNSLEGDITNRQLHCTGWSEDEKDVMDARYKVALSFAYLTIATMILLIAPVLALSCATLDATSNRLIAMCFLLAALFQGLTFLSIGSQVCQESFNCKLSFGAGITVGGILLSVLTALALLRVRNWSYYHGHDGDEKGATGEAGGGKEGTGSGHNGEEDLTHENDEEEQQTHGETTEKGGHEGDEESPSVLDAEDVEDVSLGENEDEAHVIVKEATA